MSMPSPVRSQRRSAALGLLSLLGLVGCAPVSGPRQVPLLPVSRPEPPPLAQRRIERIALLGAARDRVLARAAAHGQLLTQSALGDRIRRLAAPLIPAAGAVRAEALTTPWPIDVIAGDLVGQAQSEGGQPNLDQVSMDSGIMAADVIPLMPVSLVIVLPADHHVALPEGLLSALIAHGLAHGLRDHPLETDLLIDGLPGFSAIQEREADRDTCEILARAGLDPRLAWQLRQIWEPTDPPGGRSTGPWPRRHPDPPHARQAIESFAARVDPLRAAAAAVR